MEPWVKWTSLVRQEMDGLTQGIGNIGPVPLILYNVQPGDVIMSLKIDKK